MGRSPAAERPASPINFMWSLMRSWLLPLRRPAPGVALSFAFREGVELSLPITRTLVVALSHHGTVRRPLARAPGEQEQGEDVC